MSKRKRETEVEESLDSNDTYSEESLGTNQTYSETQDSEYSEKSEFTESDSNDVKLNKINNTLSYLLYLNEEPNIEYSNEKNPDLSLIDYVKKNIKSITDKNTIDSHIKLLDIPDIQYNIIEKVILNHYQEQ